jgi:Na+/melibiose symporter-like transporter
VPRAGPGLSQRTRLAYGLGLAAEGIKSNTFNTFLLFFYQQIVGLDARLCGLALFVALLIDAVTDPTMGVISDGWRSRLGRRHPFMYAGAVPMALCYVAVFLPPTAMSTTGQFTWLLVFAVGVRLGMTLFGVPYAALGAELTSDYDERTVLQSLRTLFAWIFGLANAALAYQFFLATTPEFSNGLLNPAGYPPFALFGAVLIATVTLWSALGTQRAAIRAEAARSAQLAAPSPSLRELFGEMRSAFSSVSYRNVVIAGLLFFTAFGTAQNLVNYMSVYFWGFRSEQVALFIYVLFASSILGPLLAKPLSARFDKGPVAVAATLVMTVLGTGVVALRLVDALPPNDDPRLLYLLLANSFVAYTATIVAMIMVSTMVADTTDERELTTGARQEGLLFSANSFVSKASSGLGVLVSGFVISLAGLAENVAPESVAPSVIVNLGIWNIAGGILMGGGAAYAFSRYRITRREHDRILSTLGARRPVS